MPLFSDCFKDPAEAKRLARVVIPPGHPWPPVGERGCCEAVSPPEDPDLFPWLCTLPDGHEGFHVATTGGEVVAWWE